MFEAHTLSADEADFSLLHDAQWQRRYHRLHRASLRPLTIWFAAGKRKDRQQIPHEVWFIYIEYRDDTGNNRFLCLERKRYGQTVQALLEEATQLSIPTLADS